jgi:hypothetical protein
VANHAMGGKAMLFAVCALSLTQNLFRSASIHLGLVPIPVAVVYSNHLD